MSAMWIGGERAVGGLDHANGAAHVRRLAAAALGATALTFLALAVGSPAASGKAIEVKPGKNAIQKAVDRAKSGDALRIRNGHYPEVVTVDKRLKIWGVDKRRPTIDGECGTNLTLAVTHGGVVLKHLKVVGAAAGFGSHPTQVDFRFLGRGKAKDLVLRESCGPEDAAEYGINLFATRRVNVIDSVAKGGHTDAGIYLGAIQGTGGGSTIVRGNGAFNNTVGIIVEDSFGDIQVRENRVHDNRVAGVHTPGGIFINRASGALYDGNTVTDNGSYGVRLGSGADGNVLDNNVLTGNPSDLLNAGIGNCGAGNTIGAGPGLPPC